MNAVRQALVDFATAVSGGALRGVVEELRQQGEINLSALERRLAQQHSKELLRRLLRESEAQHLSASRLAGMLEGASYVVEHQQDLSPELVWTGPAPNGTATRRTEQVMLEVIRAAKERLFLTSFVAYKVDTIVTELNQATHRGVDVRILLESAQGNGGTLSIDSIPVMKKNLPRVSFFSWQERSGEFAGGSMHAKVAVADSHLAFITSANLTGHAMQRNIEAGVLLRGGSHPKRLAEYLNALVSNSVITQL
jgi:phosphatidylserine/phosphatidylglycerophosphate/cardiolipin synthase-like enzyme